MSVAVSSAKLEAFDLFLPCIPSIDYQDNGEFSSGLLLGSFSTHTRASLGLQR